MPSRLLLLQERITSLQLRTEGWPHGCPSFLLSPSPSPPRFVLALFPSSPEGRLNFILFKTASDSLSKLFANFAGYGYSGSNSQLERRTDAAALPARGGVVGRGLLGPPSWLRDLPLRARKRALMGKPRPPLRRASMTIPVSSLIQWASGFAPSGPKKGPHGQSPSALCVGYRRELLMRASLRRCRVVSSGCCRP